MEKKIEDNPSLNTVKGISVVDIISVFLDKKKRIFVITGIICVISIILYFFVFDLIYMSTASIKSSAKSSGLLGALDGSIPDISGLDDIGIGGSKSAKELSSYEEILTSRRCLEELIQKFKLMERDEYKFMEDAVKDFRESKLLLKQEKLAGILYVSVLDKDPVLAKDMVQFLLNKLDNINIELNVLNAKNNREFIEKRYYQSRIDLQNSEDSLKIFQQVYGVSPDLQIKAAAQSQFTLEAELKSEEVKLDVLKKILSPDQVEVKTQEAKINAIKSKVLEIRNSTDLNDLLRLGNSPDILMSYLRLQREVEIQSKIVSFLLPLFEQAKIEEKRETPTILVLDNPNIAERKTKPKRLTMVVALTFFGFLFTTAYYVIRNRLKIWKTIIDIERKRI